MKFKPLRHGERFLMTLPDFPPQKFICRTGPMSPARALREGWAYATVCTAEEEGITWARGWNTKAAKALRVACAL